jgi:alkylated DNA repair dioxygenase AlkB
MTPTLHFRPRFLPNPDDLFQHLLNTVAWDARMRARKTASYGVAYNYSQMHYPAQPLPHVLQEVAQRLLPEIGFLPNNCLLNYYEDGLASMGFHSDSLAELEPETGVAIVSLGSERELVFRHKQDKTNQHRYALPSGSLLYMPQAIQETWLHGLPASSHHEPRISLTFRAMRAES